MLAFARSEKEKECEEFELRSYPSWLDCPFLLATPMAVSCLLLFGHIQYIVRAYDSRQKLSNFHSNKH